MSPSRAKMRPSVARSGAWAPLVRTDSRGSAAPPAATRCLQGPRLLPLLHKPPQCRHRRRNSDSRRVSRGERIAANRVRFVKIDVDGFEFEVIRGMPLVLEARPLVVTEFSPVYMRRSGVDPAGFLWFFGSRGYRPYRIRHRALTRVEPRELEVSVTNENVFWKE